MVPDNTMELETTYMGGGPFATLPPVFKEDGTNLYVAWQNVLHGYNVKTGKQVLEFNGLRDEIVGFGLAYKREEENLVACAKNGKVQIWNVEDATRIKFIALPVKGIKSFLPIADKTCHKTRAVVVFQHKKKSKLSVAIANLRNYSIRNVDIVIDNTTPYYIDVGEIENDGKFVVFAQGKFLHYIQLDGEDNGNFFMRRHMLGSDKHYTALCTPRTPTPLPLCLAGDSRGRITLYTDLRLPRPPHSDHHWHTLPVRALALSPSGTLLYSGGAEAVLVRWEVGAGAGRGPGEGRRFVPRMGGEVGGVTVGGASGGETWLAVTVVGDGVHVFEAGRMERTGVIIRRLAMGCTTDVGLVYDNRSKCLLLNGTPGHIQFYSPCESTLLYTMDVVLHNKLTDERDQPIANINVKKIAVNQTGLWYATVEERQDTDAIYELRLKFWQFDEEKQAFRLNTSIEYPHEKLITGIEFRPNRKEGTLEQCVTISDDGLFKNWQLVQVTGVDGVNSLTWRCATTAYYKPPFCAKSLAFSHDGSILALGYGPALTVWLPDSCQLKKSLTYPRMHEDIRHIKFGRGNCSYLIVAATEKMVMVWNLLTYTLMTKLAMQVAYLLQDPSTSIMVIIEKNNTVHFFEPNEVDLKIEFKLPESKSIEAAAFVPSETVELNLNNQKTKLKSRLFYLNSKKEMYCLGPKIKKTENYAEILEREGSNFSRLLAEKLTNSVKNQERGKITHQNSDAKTELNRILDTPNHTQIPMSLLACSFLHSMVLKDDKSSEIDEITNKIITTDNKTENSKVDTIEVDLNKIKLKHTEWISIL